MASRVEAGSRTTRRLRTRRYRGLSQVLAAPEVLRATFLGLRSGSAAKRRRSRMQIISAMSNLAPCLRR